MTTISRPRAAGISYRRSLSAVGVGLIEFLGLALVANAVYLHRAIAAVTFNGDHYRR